MKIGYYTNYEIRWEGYIDVDEVKKKLKELSNGYNFYDEDGRIILSDSKWYDYEAVMDELSMLYPKVKFTVYGEGEENFFDKEGILVIDMWVQTFQDGKVSDKKIPDKIIGRWTI